MKGRLEFKDNDWYINYGREEEITRILLHPDDVDCVDDFSKYFDEAISDRNKYPDVDFYIIEECKNYGGKHWGRDCSCKSGFISYGRINKK